MAKGSITVSMGLTKNMGNFENFKLGADITVEVDDVYDEEAWNKAWTKVDQELDKKLKEVE